ncbi:alcohol dehydrogenase family protein [Aliiroseovarius sp.]|uniref:alcohol dehydrogenase family protein n=1 Tax=Aliiroseovarius sp. TaxID=1872442 RepID=UPI002601F3E4|nr:alcohol dehydrogenase family protein [Aliiroseovarius sp.]
MPDPRPSNLPDTMFAIVTTGNGGYDRLEPRRVPLPRPGPGEVLLRVLAAGVNNTEINTRLGWYSASVTDSTDATQDAQTKAGEQKSDGGWAGATPFPLIQGTDCCGLIVAVGEGVKTDRIGERVIVRACMRVNGFDNLDCLWMASDFDGAFAQYVKVPAGEVFPVDTPWTDAELATIPCAYGTAETMLTRARVGPGDRVLVTGASGGVGSATVQLAKCRGAEVVAVAGASKLDALRDLGADRLVSRDADLLAELGDNAVDVVVDNVAGPGFPVLLKLMKRGGRYASSGAIAGPIVALDMRDMYLKDITLYGSTAWDEPVFPRLVSLIEAGKLTPLVAATYPLERIAAAQEAFLKKRHVGNFVLIPPEE